jgi:hypothetical protein
MLEEGCHHAGRARSEVEIRHVFRSSRAIRGSFVRASSRAGATSLSRCRSTIKWAGDTPVITLTDLSIPGMGTYTARAILYNDQRRDLERQEGRRTDFREVVRNP